MKEIESNKHAWGQVPADHYQSFKKSLAEDKHHFNPYIQNKLGDLKGKKVINLQCNTGADTMLLAKMAESAVGVDLVPNNIHYAKKLADDFNVTNAKFIESGIMEFMEKHNEKYDVVFVSEGAIGWLPYLEKWGKTIRHLLKQAYFWMYTIAGLINSLASAGLHIEYFNEFKENIFDAGGLNNMGNGLYNYSFNKSLFGISISVSFRQIFRIAASVANAHTSSSMNVHHFLAIQKICSKIH